MWLASTTGRGRLERDPAPIRQELRSFGWIMRNVTRRFQILTRQARMLVRGFHCRMRLGLRAHQAVTPTQRNGERPGDRKVRIPPSQHGRSPSLATAPTGGGHGDGACWIQNPAAIPAKGRFPNNWRYRASNGLNRRRRQAVSHSGIPPNRNFVSEPARCPQFRRSRKGGRRGLALRPLTAPVVNRREFQAPLQSCALCSETPGQAERTRVPL